ncbi:MAG: hypothetical protein ACR2Q4_04730, partial [Geminicoccaceae bacterium]
MTGRWQDVNQASAPDRESSFDAEPNLNRGSAFDRRSRLVWAIALGLFALLCLTGRPVAGWAFKVPKGWRIPLKRWIGDAMDWLVQDASFGLF